MNDERLKFLLEKIFIKKKRKRKKNYPKMNKYNQIFWQEKQHQIQISKYLLLMLIISATVIHIGKNNNNWKLHDMIIDSDTKFNTKKKIGMKLKKIETRQSITLAYTSLSLSHILWYEHDILITSIIIIIIIRLCNRPIIELRQCF